MAGALTFLFTDIEGSTRRWAESEKMGELLARHDEIVHDTTTGYSGRIVKHTGDGVFAVFDRASDAVEAAIAIQRGLDGLAYESEPVRVRMGLHAGEAIDRDGDLFGLEVSTCARIMSAAHGGQILASEAVRVLVRQLDRVDFVPLGSHRLKDLADPRVLFQISAPGLADGFPPIRTLETALHNLPVQLTSFIGRREDVKAVVDLVDEHRLVTLTGVGGTGKTRLSLQAAAELSDRFADGVWFVELAPVTDPEAVPITVASVLGVRHERGQPDEVRDRLADHLRSRHMLIVIDNCEHLLESVARLVGEVLVSAPEVRILASSREALGLVGEQIRQVSSLEVGDTEDAEAVQLFLERAQAVAPHLVWNEATADHIMRICRLLDGIPLAIELAAARARVLSPEQIAARLDDRFRLLTGGSRAALPRQQTLEATVDWSYRMLSAQERALFRRLSVFVGGFSLEAAEAVATGEGLDEHEVLDVLARLVDRSMVQTEHGEAGVDRYRMLETLRAFGFARLADSNEAERWKDRHLDYFVAWLEALDVFGWDLGPAKRVAGERGNLTAVLDWGLGQRHEGVWRVAAALGVDRYVNLGDLPEALRLLDVAVDHVPAWEGTRLRLLATRARILHGLGRIDEFLALSSSIAEAAVRASDADAVWALARVGVIHAFDPEFDPAHGLTLTGVAVERSASLPDPARFRALHDHSFASLWSGEPEHTMSLVEQTLEIGRRLDPTAVLAALETLTLAAMTVDERDGTDLTTSVEDEALALWRQAAPTEIPEILLWAGIRRGWWTMVDDELSRLLPSHTGVRQVWLLMPRAVLRMMQGRLDESEQAFDLVSSLAPIRRWYHDYYPTRAEIAAWRGDLTQAERWVGEHRAVPVAASERILLVAGLRALVRAAVEVGDTDRAADALEELRQLRSAGGEMPAVQLGSPAFYLASAEAEFTRLHRPDPAAWHRAAKLATWVYWRRYCEVRETLARSALGEDVALDAAELREALDGLGTQGLIDLLDSATR